MAMQTNGNDTLGYTVLGCGPSPVMVMHEWMGDHTNYDLIHPYLDREAFTWIFVDLRGYGLSRQLTGKFTCREAAADILALADRLNLGTFHLIGHSMSALVAQRVAASAPDRVSTLIAVTPLPASGAPFPDGARPAMEKVITDDDAAMEAIHLRTGERYNRSWLLWKLSLARRASTIPAREGYLSMILDTDFEDDAKDLAVPVRVITGAHDIPLFREASLREPFTRLYPDLEILTIGEAGHYPMLECPILFASTVERFCRESEEKG